MGVYGILIGEEDICRFTERIIHGGVGGCTQIDSHSTVRRRNREYNHCIQSLKTKYKI
jgi:hypothetical protein